MMNKSRLSHASVSRGNVDVDAPLRASGLTLALALALPLALGSEPLPAQDQIGIALGSTPEAAEVDIHRAMAGLRELVQGEGRCRLRGMRSREGAFGAHQED